MADEDHFQIDEVLARNERLKTLIDNLFNDIDEIELEHPDGHKPHLQSLKEQLDLVNEIRIISLRFIDNDFQQ